MCTIPKYKIQEKDKMNKPKKDKMNQPNTEEIKKAIEALPICLDGKKGVTALIMSLGFKINVALRNMTKENASASGYKLLANSIEEYIQKRISGQLK